MMLSILALSVASLGLQDLPQQKIAPGQCVIMLWSKAQPPLRIAMIDEQRQTLLLQRNRRAVTLAASGPSHYSGDGLSIGVDLVFRDGAAVSNGAIIDSGSIDITAADGETLVLPVGGIRACQ